MLNDLDKTLEKFLKATVSSLQGANTKAEISFAPPSKDHINPNSEKSIIIDLFLYDVRENLELRSNQRSVVRQSNGNGNFNASIHHPPVRVDCSYLITVWLTAQELAHLQWQEEHRILGEVMEVLLRYSTIPEEYLEGRLQEQNVPLGTFAARPSLLNSLGEFWQAMGDTPPKAALNYTVTIPVLVYQPQKDLPVITEKVIAPKLGDLRGRQAPQNRV